MAIARASSQTSSRPGKTLNCRFERGATDAEPRVGRVHVDSEGQGDVRHAEPIHFVKYEDRALFQWELLESAMHELARLLELELFVGAARRVGKIRDFLEDFDPVPGEPAVIRGHA
jgi:hypothetical protein